MREKDILMEIRQVSLEKRLEMLSEGQKMYIQGYLDGILRFIPDAGKQGGLCKDCCANLERGQERPPEAAGKCVNSLKGNNI